MKLIEANSIRIKQPLDEYNMTIDDLASKGNIPIATLKNILSCSLESIRLKTILSICRVFKIELADYYRSDLFDMDNLDDSPKNIHK